MKRNTHAPHAIKNPQTGRSKLMRLMRQNGEKMDFLFAYPSKTSCLASLGSHTADGCDLPKLLGDFGKPHEAFGIMKHGLQG